MPIPKGRGKVLRTRTVKAGKDKYMHCEVMSKAGPQGGRTVCGKPKKRKNSGLTKSQAMAKRGY